MNLNFDQEVKELILRAKKLSIGQMNPIVKEELIFLILIKQKHALWIILSKQLNLSERSYTNFLYNAIISGRLDDRENPENRKLEKKYFSIAAKLARQSSAFEINAYILLKAIFLAKGNAVVKCFRQHGISSNRVLEELDKISHSDLIETLGNRDQQSSFVPSKRSVAAAENMAQSSIKEASFGRNLNKLAQSGELDSVFFRDDEIDASIEILCRRRLNNPLLVGYAGVGKTAIVEGIAQDIVKGHVPEIMKNKEIIEISLSTMLAGTIYRGQFEERIQDVIKQCSENPNLILFIFEIHMLVGSGGQEGTGDAANIFKPALARGELRCIGATTVEEYKRYIWKDKALSRRFQTVRIKEPTYEFHQ